MFKSLIAATAVAATMTLALPAQEAKADVDVDIGIGVGGFYPGNGYGYGYGYGYRPGYYGYRPGYYGEGYYGYDSHAYRISCGTGRRIVDRSGFNKVRAIDCSGPNFRYSAWKHGREYVVRVNRAGDITRIRRVD